MLTGVAVPLSRRAFRRLGECQIQSVHRPTAYSVQDLPRSLSPCLVQVGNVLKHCLPPPRTRQDRAKPSGTSPEPTSGLLSDPPRRCREVYIEVQETSEA